MSEAPEPQTVAVVLGVGDPPAERIVILPLGNALAEFFRLEGVFSKTEVEERVFAALRIAVGTVPTIEGATQQLYDAFLPPTEGTNV